MTVYDRIKQRRRLLKMSQELLAHKCGYADRSAIAWVEAGRIDLPQSKLVKIANALNTTPAYLMGWEEEAKLQPIIDKIRRLDDADLARLSERIDTMLEDQKYVDREKTK